MSNSWNRTASLQFRLTCILFLFFKLDIFANLGICCNNLVVTCLDVFASTCAKRITKTQTYNQNNRVGYYYLNLEKLQNTLWNRFFLIFKYHVNSGMRHHACLTVAIATASQIQSIKSSFL